MPFTRVISPTLILVVLSSLSFFLGVFLPFFRTEKFFFCVEDVSILSSVGILLENDDYFLAIVTFIFSILFPLLKYLLLFFVFIQKNNRQLYIKLLNTYGKYSMTEVFALAAFIVVMKTNGIFFLDVSLRIGAVFFGLAVITGLIASALIKVPSQN